jgi:hypothetical protein
VSAPPLIVPDSSSARGVSLKRYRQRLADSLGYFAVATVTTLASSLEAERRIFASEFVSDQASPDHFDGLYVFVLDGLQAGATRQLVSGTYDGALGSLIVDNPFAAPLAVGTHVELGVLPAVRYLGQAGFRQIINLALEELSVIDRVSFTATANTIEYSLANYPWPIKGVSKLYDPRTSTTDRLRETSQPWSFTNDAESPLLTLNSAYAAGDVFILELLRPASTRIRQGGAWGDSLDGLVDDTDEALYDVSTLAKQARPIALRRLAKLHDAGSQERAELLGEADNEQTKAALSRFLNRFKNGRGIKVGAVGRR